MWLEWVLLQALVFTREINCCRDDVSLSWCQSHPRQSHAGPVQYLHSLSWVVQPPSVPELGVLHTDSLLERIASQLQLVEVVVAIFTDRQ